MNNTYKTNKTDWRRLGRGILFVALLLAAGLPAGAQNNYYVITYTTGGTTYYLARNGTSGVQRVSTFDPTICIWSCSSNTAGTTASTLGTSNRYLFQVVNGTRYFLNYNLGLGTTAGNNYRVRTDNNLLYFYSSYRYIILSGATPTYSTTTTTGRARADQITSSTVASISTNPTISGADVLTATGNSTYTASGEAYRFGGYTDYSFNDVHVYLDANGNTITPANATLTNAWSLTDNAYATVNSTSGVVTVSSLPESDLTLTLTVTTAVTGGTPAAPANTTLTASKVITIQGTKPSAPTITVNGTSVTLATTAIGSTSIHYTTNGTDPTTTTGTVYSSAIDLSTSATSPVTIKAITVRNGNASDVSSEVVTLTLPAPTITINGDAQTATIASSVAGATIYYTTDGSTPTTSSSPYTGDLTGLAMMTTVKAIAVKDGWNNSPVASGIVTIPSGVSGGVVTLFDYEPHSWAYYSDTNCPIRSLNPADVKITYHGNGTKTVSTTNGTSPAAASWTSNATDVQVSYNEADSVFVYYKTLERTDGGRAANAAAATGRCAYRVIPNPFYKRPVYNTGDARWRGFYAWRIKSISKGKIYTDSTGTNQKTAYTSGNLATANYLVADSVYYFAPDGEYGMEIELEALWARAYVTTGSTSLSTYVNSGPSPYERNFHIVTSTNQTASNYQKSYPVTISSRYPDGSNGGGNFGNGDFTATSDTKFEYLAINGTVQYRYYRLGNSPGQYYPGTYRDYDTYQGETLTYGGNTYGYPDMIGTQYSADGHSMAFGRGCSGKISLICGATSDPTSDFNLRYESGTFYASSIFKSISVTSSITVNATFGCDYDRAYNNGAGDNTKMSIIDGFKLGSGAACTSSDAKINVYVLSGTYGEAAADREFYVGFSGVAATSPSPRFLEVLGGNFLGGIAGGIEAKATTGGIATTTNVLTMRFKGGTVGRYLYSSGQHSPAFGSRKVIITGGTFNCFVTGGCYGTYADEGNTEGSGRIYFGGDAKQTVSSNGVFGAGYGQNNTAYSNGVYDSEGATVIVADVCEVAGSVYGGGNIGYANDDVDVHVLGGTVKGNVFGGANKAPSKGKVDVIMRGGTVEGDVYGGSNQSGDITGTVKVKVYGGTVNGGVYGCNNAGGAPQSTVNVDIYGTDPQPGSGYAIHQVFGGGNQAAYSGTPVVTVHDSSCNISIGEVYGGGLGTTATVTGTNVTIEAGNIIGDVYGGGRQAPVGNGGTSVTINGGTIRRVFGGNNISGAIASGTAGKIVVNVDKTASCPMKIGQVFGGGNQAASQVGRITVGCTGDLVTPLSSGQRYGYDQEGIGAVYGGANNAAITGNIALSIVSGIVDSVFGGNNDGGDIDGDITVNINKNGSATCANHWYVGYVFGGGNNAEYSQKTANHPAVNVSAGLVTHHVFGGGNGEGAVVYGNPTVTLSGTAQVGGNVYGGGNAAAVNGNTSVKLQD